MRHAKRKRVVPCVHTDDLGTLHCDDGPAVHSDHEYKYMHHGTLYRSSFDGFAAMRRMPKAWKGVVTCGSPCNHVTVKVWGNTSNTRAIMRTDAGPVATYVLHQRTIRVTGTHCHALHLWPYSNPPTCEEILDFFMPAHRHGRAIDPAILLELYVEPDAGSKQMMHPATVSQILTPIVSPSQTPGLASTPGVVAGPSPRRYVIKYSERVVGHIMLLCSPHPQLTKCPPALPLHALELCKTLSVHAVDADARLVATPPRSAELQVHLRRGTMQRPAFESDKNGEAGLHWGWSWDAIIVYAPVVVGVRRDAPDVVLCSTADSVLLKLPWGFKCVWSMHWIKDGRSSLAQAPLQAQAQDQAQDQVQDQNNIRWDAVARVAGGRVAPKAQVTCMCPVCHGQTRAAASFKMSGTSPYATITMPRGAQAHLSCWAATIATCGRCPLVHVPLHELVLAHMRQA